MAYERNKQLEWARKDLSNSVKWWTEANVDMVMKRVTPEMSGGDIAVLIDKMGEQGLLVVSRVWSQPFEEFYASDYGRRFFSGQANESVLVSALVAAGKGLKAADLELVASDPDVVSRLALRPEFEAAEREQRRRAAQADRERIEAEQIRAELLGFLTNGPREAMLKKAGAYPTIFPMEVKKERERLAAIGHAALVEEVTRRREVRRVKGLSKEDYRAEVTISRAAGEQPTMQPKMTQALSSQYETLPAQFTTRGGLTINMDRAGILKVANTDSFAFRELVRRFGSEAINDLLAGRA